ncbi:MAG: glycoside hydrolase family 15 protein [Candidatus Dormiibacterota bacterium]
MPYKPIEEYGIIGDLDTLALVGTDGAIDYLCYPHFDSPTIFAALLDDQKGGDFTIGPLTGGARLKQMYLPDTNVLLTRFLSDDGVGEITDFMPVDDARHPHAIVRRVTGVRGPFSFTFRCAPRFDYGRAEHTVEQRDGVVIFRSQAGDGMVLRLQSPVPLEVRAGAAVGEFTLDADETVDFVFEAIDPAVATPPEEPPWVDLALRHTMDYWRKWAGRSRYRGQWKEMVGRSALAIKLLTSLRFGSIAAAGTFGLPEMVGGERNWDYRYTWIRDASLTAATLIRLGFVDSPRAFVEWIEQRYREAEEPGKLQIMYGIDGRHDLTEETLGHLEGYRKSAPVRVGNAAYEQLQVDIYGELLYLIDLFDENVERISYDFWQHISCSVNWVCDNWARPDEGIWEVRGGPQEFLYSRLMSWVALDRGIRIAQRRALPAPLDRWIRERDAVHHDIYHDFWHPERNAFVQHKGSNTLDASTLLMPMVGFIASRDPRWLATLESIGRELTDDVLVYRYLTEQAAADGLTGNEGTFCMCSYWYIECLARAGQLEKAQLLFEKMHGYANHLGLYAEEMDPTGRYLGNFPQAFTHIGLISTALYLEQALSDEE